MNISWDDARLFLAIAEAGSLSQAARKLGVGQPTMSRRLAVLEDQLGYALFRRSVDGAVLTSSGERLVEPARKMAEWAGELTRTAMGVEAKARGLVRITAPPGVAYDFVAPFAGWVRARYPELRIEVLSSIQHLDLTRGEADLALRTRFLEQRDLVKVATHESEVAVFASRAYRKRLPRKYGFADVGFIAWAPPLDHLSPTPELAALIPGFVPTFTSDNYLVQLRAAEEGLGAMFLGTTRHRFNRKTLLVPLALDVGPHVRGELHLVAAKSALEIPRVRAVAELLAQELVTTTKTTQPQRGQRSRRRGA